MTSSFFVGVTTAEDPCFMCRAQNALKPTERDGNIFECTKCKRVQPFLIPCANSKCKARISSLYYPTLTPEMAVAKRTVCFCSRKCATPKKKRISTTREAKVFLRKMLGLTIEQTNAIIKECKNHLEETGRFGIALGDHACLLISSDQRKDDLERYTSPVVFSTQRDLCHNKARHLLILPSETPDEVVQTFKRTGSLNAKRQKVEDFQWNLEELATAASQAEELMKV